MTGLKMLRIEDVIERLGIGRTKIYQLVRDGSFPKPVKLDRCSRWPEHEVDNWLKEMTAKRDRKY